MVTDVTIASAPGKVLLTGGYLVLEQAFSGLVIGTSARFYTAIQPDEQHNSNLITVHSPQFENATWQYQVLSSGGLKLEAVKSETQNKFVETCLRFALEVIYQRIDSANFESLLNKGVVVTIVGDNDFYSQRAQLNTKGLPNTADSLASLEPFCKTHATLSTVHKTGLGSSAALTTSLVAALFLHFKVVSDSLVEREKKLIHNVAQYVHCFAQGKVGSGFDVSSAVWGSHRYRRFNPSILTPIMDEKVDSKTLSNTLDADNQSWDNDVCPFTLPPGFDLMLADIDAGSHTPTLVGKVLGWKKSKPEEAESLWNNLGKYNSLVEQHFRNLTKLFENKREQYDETIRACAQLKTTKWHTVEGPVAEEMAGLVQDFDQVRALLREMSCLSEVPIEPVEQTKLLDACMNVPGVAMAGVPGAGGFDAIFCIVLSDQSKSDVRQVWQSWKELNVGPLLSQADSNGVTSVRLDSAPALVQVLR